MEIGLPYIPEVNDCFQAVRRAFEPLGIHIRDYAFPSDFWDHNDSMFERLFKREGFYSIDIDNWEPQPYDVLMVAGSMGVSFPTHFGVLIEDNKVYHHYTDRFSAADAFKGIWRRPLRVIRHESFRNREVEEKRFDVTELMPDHVRARFLQPPE